MGVAAAASSTTAAAAARRPPHRLLLAGAALAALSLGLLLLGAISAGHTELRLSADVQLSIGSRLRDVAAAAAAHAQVLQGGSGDWRGGGAADAQPALPAAAQPPLPEGEPPGGIQGAAARGGGAASSRDPYYEQEEEEEEDGDVAYGAAAYERADMLSLTTAVTTAKQQALTAGDPQPKPKPKLPKGGDGTTALWSRSAGRGGQAAKGQPVITAAAAAARDSGAACGEVGDVSKGQRMKGRGRAAFLPHHPRCTRDPHTHSCAALGRPGAGAMWRCCAALHIRPPTCHATLCHARRGALPAPVHRATNCSPPPSRRCS